MVYRGGSGICPLIHAHISQILTDSFHDWAGKEQDYLVFVARDVCMMPQWLQLGVSAAIDDLV